MDAKTLADKFIQVQVTPQGTADVYLGGVHIKTFGVAAAANSLKDQLVSVVEAIVHDWEAGLGLEEVGVDKVEPEVKEVDVKKKLTFWP